MQLKYFPLQNQRTQTISIQPSAEIIHVGYSPATSGKPGFWAVVNPNEETREFTFHLLSTNSEIPEGTSHLGSYTDTHFLWHLFA